MKYFIAGATQELLQFSGIFELDERYFSEVIKGKCGRGSAGKVAVFGILKLGSKVCTQIVLDTKINSLMPIMRSNIELDSIVHTDFA